MKFSTHYFQEKTVEGIVSNKKIEQGIVDVINNGKTNLKRFEPAIKAIVDHLDLHGNAEHTGNKMGSLNNEFVELMNKFYPASLKSVNKTCKTDFVVSNDKISLKLNKGWIFANQLEGTQVCFNVVLNKHKELNDAIKDNIFSILEELRTRPKQKSEKNYVLKDEITASFHKIFNSLENDIKLDFIKSALTGDFKFKSDDIGSADKLMVIKFKNSKMNTTDAFLDVNNLRLDDSKIYDIMTDNNYINKILSTARVTFYVQTSGRIRFDVNSTDIDGNILKEHSEVLSEGFLDDISNLLKKGYEFAKDKIQQLIRFLVDLFNQGVVYVMKFFGINIDVKFENEIIFP